MPPTSLSDGLALFSKPFDALETGARFVTPERTISEQDVRVFAELTGDRHPQHLDEQWAAASRFGSRIAHGMLVLSENAGAYDELGAFSLGVNPFDIVQQAEALHEALTTEPGRRRDLHDTARQMVEHNDAAKWLQQQLDTLDRHVAVRGSR